MSIALNATKLSGAHGDGLIMLFPDNKNIPSIAFIESTRKKYSAREASTNPVYADRGTGAYIGKRVYISPCYIYY